MKLEDVKEVKTSHTDEEVNEYLKKGFIIKKIIQTKINGDDISPCFILVKT